MDAETVRVRFVSPRKSSNPNLHAAINIYCAAEIRLIPHRFDQDSPSSRGTPPALPKDDQKTRPDSRQLLRNLYVPAPPKPPQEVPQDQAGHTMDSRARLRHTIGALQTPPPAVQPVQAASRNAPSVEVHSPKFPALPPPPSSPSQPQDTRELLRSIFSPQFSSTPPSNLTYFLADHRRHLNAALSPPEKRPGSHLNPDDTLPNICSGHLAGGTRPVQNRLEELRGLFIPSGLPPQPPHINNDIAVSASRRLAPCAKSVPASAPSERATNALGPLFTNQRGQHDITGTMDCNMEVDESPHDNDAHHGSPPRYDDALFATPPRTNAPESKIGAPGALSEISSLHPSSSPPQGQTSREKLRGLSIQSGPPPQRTGADDAIPFPATRPSAAATKSILSSPPTHFTDKGHPIAVDALDTPDDNDAHHGSPPRYDDALFATPPRTNAPESKIGASGALSEISSLHLSSSPPQGQTSREKLRGLSIQSGPPPQRTGADDAIPFPATRPSAAATKSILSSPPTHFIDKGHPIAVDALDTPGPTMRFLDVKFPNHIESLRNREVRAKERLILQTQLQSSGNASYSFCRSSQTQMQAADPVLNISEEDYLGRPLDDGPTIHAISEYVRLYQPACQRRRRALERILAIFDKLDELQSSRDEIDNGLYNEPLE
ncbi:hypothetical protein EV363DRAFT_1454329 [Boletus edulis]|nr:hypothetical protein EV363DRAFT_1454329 [Boletus edulis]